jgi:serine/threonine-protein kinase RsbW
VSVQSTGGFCFCLELPSDTRVIETAVRYLARRCLSEEFAGRRLDLNFRVGVTEALANAMLYGNQADPCKTVRVDIVVDPARVEVRVSDEGEGFDPASLPDPTLPSALERTGGRGVFLIQNLMDEVEYSPRGNSVRLVLYRDPCASSGGGT